MELTATQAKEEVAKVYRIFEGAKKMIEVIAAYDAMENNKKFLEKDVEKLHGEQSALLSKRDEALEGIDKAKAKASQIVAEAEMKSDKMAENEKNRIACDKKFIDDENKVAFAEIERLKGQIEAAKSILSEVNTEIRDRKSEISALKEQKQKLLEAFK